MKIKKKFATTSIILRKFLLIVISFLIIGCFTGISQVKADSTQAQVKLNNCYSNSGSQIIIKASIQSSLYNYVKIYRTEKSPSHGGTFKLLDQMPIWGQTWYSAGNNYWSTAAEKNKITCYSQSAHISGNVLFADNSVRVGHRYYYKIVMKSQYAPSLTSNIVHATVKLSAPTLTRSYSLDGKTAKLLWTRTAQAKGYQIYRYDGKKWKNLRTINKSSTLTYTDKSVKAGKTYKYKVRSYAIVSGKKIYSPFSSINTVSLKQSTVSGDYKVNSIYGPSLNTSQLTQVRRVVQSFKTNYIRKGMSDYDKALAAFLYLRSNCRYAARGWQYNNANTAWGALVYNEAQCSGFARAMKALCDGIGVKCYYVHANAKASNPSHQWNEICVGGKWYIVDAQGGFFLAGSRTWKNTMGMRWNTNGIPKCSANDHKNFGFYGSII